MSAEELITSLSEAVAAQGALPMPAGPAPRTLDVVEEELTGVSLSLWEEEQENKRLFLAWGSARMRSRRKNEALKKLRAQVAELEAERHSTNEALDDAVQALRADRDRIAELEAERAKYVGKEPTIAEEMAYLSRCVNAVDAFCHEMSRQGITVGGPFTVAAVRRLIEGGGLSAGGLFLADVDGADPTLWPSEAAARAHCVAVLGSELEGRAYDWAPVEGGVSQVRFVDEPGWGAARVWPLTVSSAADEDECTCPETDRVEPHWSGCPLEDAPCPVDGPIPGVGTGAGAPEMRALRAALYGPPDGEHYAQVHHAYLLGHDLPETGGTQ